MKESEDFYRRYVLPRFSKWGDCCRVENSSVSGTPDINYAFDEVNGWIELKVLHGRYYYFRKFQIPWLKRRYRNSIDVWILSADPKKKLIKLHTVPQLLSAERRVSGNKVLVPANTFDHVLSCDISSDWQQLRQILTHAH